MWVERGGQSWVEGRMGVGVQIWGFARTPTSCDSRDATGLCASNRAVVGSVVQPRSGSKPRCNSRSRDLVGEDIMGALVRTRTCMQQSTDYPPGAHRIGHGGEEEPHAGGAAAEAVVSGDGCVVAARDAGRTRPRPRATRGSARRGAHATAERSLGGTLRGKSVAEQLLSLQRSPVASGHPLRIS